FDPAGMTDDPDVRIAQSVMDYLFRRLALDYLSEDQRAELGIFSAEERARQVSDTYGAPAAPPASAAGTEVDLDSLRSSAPVEHPHNHSHVAGSASHSDAGSGIGATAAAAASRSRAELGQAPPGESLSAQTAVDAPLCFTCGVTMRPAGSCYVCEQCGSTSGCS
nr:vitamin B12-dependent ribonucleotide reductase [Micromonospora sp. DSM 115978]